MDAIVHTRRIVMIDDDPLKCDLMQAFVADADDFFLAGTATNPGDGLDMVREHLPDAVIMDLELAAGSGLDFLKRLPSLGIKNKPFILVCTDNSSVIARETARRLGADFFVGKHTPDFSPGYIIDILRTVLDTAASLRVRDSSLFSPASRQNRLRCRIFAKLDALCLSPKAKGYNYLAEAILMAVETNDSSRIAGRVASKFGLNEHRVERAMQTAINSAWNRCPAEVLAANYTATVSSRTGTPSVSVFVSYFMRKIGSEIE